MGDKRGGRGKKFQKIGYVIYGIMLKFKYKVTQKPFCHCCFNANVAGEHHRECFLTVVQPGFEIRTKNQVKQAKS